MMILVKLLNLVVVMNMENPAILIILLSLVILQNFVILVSG